jgi:very-short-patch-repair endonuclease
MKTKGISDQARLLHSALLQRGIEAEIEKFDGYKHIDIAIVSAKLNIEVDGIHHFTDADAIIADLRREYFSEEKGYDTIHIPNQAIDTHLDEVADAIVGVTERRKVGS